ncbi:hypothetical protein FDUTEX481_06519 [Tolypothrix sp. PCC 7601]|nr:hypothetical protein FDUTEX481_06519 [Tolypothrix sp. PCC 7601]
MIFNFQFYVAVLGTHKICDKNELMLQYFNKYEFLQDIKI